VLDGSKGAENGKAPGGRKFLMGNLSGLYQVGLMKRIPFLFITEQVAAHLSEELRRGRWMGEMPGRDQLVKELGVSGRTVELAAEKLLFADSFHFSRTFKNCPVSRPRNSRG